MSEGTNKASFLIIEDKKQDYPKVKEIGEVKKGFTHKVERSNVLSRAELFLPMFKESNKYVKQGECEPEIQENHTGQEEKKEEKEGKCYVEMNVAVGILEEKKNEEESSEEEEKMIEEL
ncbi:hypothetical protein EHI8A_032580 [Entamoeba histolytica HM-1:IMSS-B]|uniref:Uncharacterized protein n=6 Tax=Entamoeba histolytica TaxID=5759 RepID=C4M5N3_ENTH1|nr:hypothetical protein EHI_122750 [Entamoeba histolytica HM-1:IMSS]EMD42575.1 Hypothetical protein EHI5A_010800 [Entamoeba histolytica KU27]EMH74805.1 hypothetical protein EHI8A_032580 [Entamoeba histolytica HM-1:IMSS-B]EMS16819.1 hypothetical protein KM1_010420 [Entamoeba histolytica HM-3:IMSS]ENY63557.1 hypothetical protein EHI7A_004940 [Entamoeba histolytica HM-1:IMSS-A]GAT96728.1 hypothetical protein CL6EHI_122750 [Entamoeba histolytica]|eukprot:XP_654229.1 hypothetical protein EHI_122750 [Entamoeba histolytica HM-1:IMSS]